MRLTIPLLTLTVALAGCGGSTPPARTVTLATTTSTRDSGLLDMLIPMARQQAGIDIKAIAVGSGQALEMGRRGDADVLLTHAPAAERQFIADGFAAEHHRVMHNKFVLVGPRTDAANVGDETVATKAFARIAATHTLFVSRGDQSGTHRKEMQIWQQAQIQPSGSWYLRAGAGMAQTLRIASEKQAYTLSDNGTFLTQRDRLDLAILLQGDPLLRNQYSVIVVNPKKHRHIAYQGAKKFAHFLLSDEVQLAIGRFGLERFGTPLFTADAKPRYR